MRGSIVSGLLCVDAETVGTDMDTTLDSAE